jgi:hypothetical protein
MFADVLQKKGVGAWLQIHLGVLNEGEFDGLDES